MLLAYERKHLGLCLGLAVAVALGKENMALVVGGLGVLALVERRERRWWVSLGAIGGVTVVLGVGVIIPACLPVEGVGRVHYARLATLSGWGAALSDISLYRWLGFLLVSCGFLCLRAPRKLWPLVPLLLQHGLSAHGPERSIDFHYLAPVLPLLAYAAFAGAGGLLSPEPEATASTARRARLIVGALALTNLILLAVIGWRNAAPSHGPGPFQRVTSLRSHAGVATLEAKIPPDAPAWASLSTVNRMAARERLYMVESLTLGHYLSRPWPFSLETAFDGEPPTHGLIDVRDQHACIPDGLRPIEAVGDVVLLARDGQPLVTPAAEAAAGRWVRAGGVSVRAGAQGRYAAILHTDHRAPMVQLTLMRADVQVDQRLHRLLYGHSARGSWQTSYRPHALESAPPPGPYRLYARFPDLSTPVLLSSWE
jgi:hypothetical protein